MKEKRRWWEREMYRSGNREREEILKRLSSCWNMKKRPNSKNISINAISVMNISLTAMKRALWNASEEREEKKKIYSAANWEKYVWKASRGGKLKVFENEGRREIYLSESKYEERIEGEESRSEV